MIIMIRAALSFGGAYTNTHAHERSGGCSPGVTRGWGDNSCHVCYYKSTHTQRKRERDDDHFLPVFIFLLPVIYLKR